MRKINKNPPPAALLTYVQQVGASFDDMDADVKDEVKRSLLNEQRWVCGYCQQVISDETRMKIEHFCEQSICDGSDGRDDRRLDYTNMMAVCLGNSGSQLHCDSHKAKFNAQNGLPIEVSPWIQAHMDRIQYSSSGMISSTNARHNNELNIILNLNIPRLKDLRRKKITAIYRLSKHSNNAQETAKRKRILERDIAYSNNKFANSFPGVSEFMLKRLNR